MDMASLFDDFCSHFDGKLRWDSSSAQWTEAIFSFFAELRLRQYSALSENPLTEQRDYMNIDYVWRYVSGSYEKIELAVEHENSFYREDFFNSEIRHLLDVKAENKIAITYPSSGEEQDLIAEIKERIGSYAIKLSAYFEQYLVMFGFAVTKQGKRAIRFKGYIFDRNGESVTTKDRTILQAP